MVRRVFFSFKYEDVTRAMVVRNSWVLQDSAGYIDAADFEKLKKQGDAAIKQWIDDQLKGTSVTAVLVGSETCSSRWVKYEIDESKELGHGLLGVAINLIPNFDKKTSALCARIPDGYPFYYWYGDDGYNNLGKWIEKAAQAAGK
jgi:hypothetical protein